MPRGTDWKGRVALKKRRVTPVDTYDGNDVGDEVDLEYDLYDDEVEVVSSEQGAVDDSVKQYLKEIGMYPLLSAEQELQLAERVAQGDIRAGQMLIESNLRLV